jgi:PAS domain S-box-containing protein
VAPATNRTGTNEHGLEDSLLKRILSVAWRYGLPLAGFALLLLLSSAVRRFFSFNLDLTTFIIALMIATAWYLGRGPGLLIAVIFELTLDYFSSAPYSTKYWIIVFNRTALFVSLVLFASSRRRAEQQLREQREWLRVSLKSIGDAVIATDIKGFVNFINPTAEALTSWTLSEAVRRPLAEVFHIVNEETRQPVENVFTIIRREGIVVGLANHTILIAKDGREIPIEDSGAPIKDHNGEMIGVIVVFHDVSERRRVEQERSESLKREQAARSEAEVANRLKDEFLATVSHELRTPLTAIVGWSSMLRTNNFSAESTARALETIERNAKAQTQIVEDLLDVSRIITGKLQINLRPVALAPTIEAALATLRPAAEAKAITLEVSLGQTTNLVAGDPDRLQQIIWNLVSNAIKFTPENGHVEVRLEQVGSYFELSVRDNGAGIDGEFLPYVFERFRQADSSSTRRHGGLGLGLAIVRHLVELQGGTVSAESDGAGRGAVFTVRLPLASAREAATLSEAK